MVDRATAHLAATIADELAIPATDIVATAAAAILTALRSLLDHARRDSLAGRSVDAIADRLANATNRAFDLLDGELATLGAATTDRHAQQESALGASVQDRTRRSRRG